MTENLVAGKSGREATNCTQNLKNSKPWLVVLLSRFEVEWLSEQGGGTVVLRDEFIAEDESRAHDQSIDADYYWK